MIKQAAALECAALFGDFMTLQQLRYVLTICDTGSLSRASERLYVAQPSLSSALSSLEDELGIRIFRRTARGVTPTPQGSDFLSRARELYAGYQDLMSRYSGDGGQRKKFGVSTQHYSFAVKSFVEMVKGYNTAEYDFAIRETTTMKVLDDVSTLRSQIGIIYLSDFNRSAIAKLLRSKELLFTPLCNCRTFVYLYKGHPLAQEHEITLKMLAPYPNLSFEQGDGLSFYLAEEIFSDNEYQRQIMVNDRATMVNLMIGLNGYTLCSGIFCEELNGTDYTAVPFRNEDPGKSDIMEIGYVTRKGLAPSALTEEYISLMRQALSADPHAAPAADPA